MYCVNQNALAHIDLSVFLERKLMVILLEYPLICTTKKKCLSLVDTSLNGVVIARVVSHRLTHSHTSVNSQTQRSLINKKAMAP